MAYFFIIKNYSIRGIYFFLLLFGAWLLTSCVTGEGSYFSRSVNVSSGSSGVHAGAMAQRSSPLFESELEKIDDTYAYDVFDNHNHVVSTTPSPYEIMLSIEVALLRNPRLVDFSDCYLVAKQSQSYQLARYCLLQTTRVGDTDKDIQFSLLLVEIAPDNPESYELLSQSYINHQRYSDALDILVEGKRLHASIQLSSPGYKAVFLYGNDMDVLLKNYRAYRIDFMHDDSLLKGELALLIRRMEQYYFIGKYAQAFEATSEILQTISLLHRWDNSLLNLENVYITSARSQRELGDIYGAITNLNQALLDNPQYTNVALELIDMYLFSNNVHDAKKIATQVFTDFSDNDNILLHLYFVIHGKIESISRNIRQQFRLQISKEKNVVVKETLLYRLSQLADIDGETEQRLALLAQIHQSPNILLQAVRESAHIIFEQQGKLAGLRYYAKQEKAHPEIAHQIRIARAYWLANIDREAAITYVTDIMRTHERTNAIDVLYARGFFYALQGNVAAMEKDFLTILRKEPLHVDTLNAYGYTLVDITHRSEEGLAYIQRAFALEPDNAAIVDSLAWGLFKVGKVQRSLVLVQWAYARSQDPEIASHYGEILWTLGYIEESRALLDRDRREHKDSMILQKTWERLFGT